MSAGLGQALVMATAPMSYVFGVLGGVPGWFSDVVFEVKIILRTVCLVGYFDYFALGYPVTKYI